MERRNRSNSRSLKIRFLVQGFVWDIPGKSLGRLFAEPGEAITL
jgi:hypothetical protein